MLSASSGAAPSGADAPAPELILRDLKSAARKAEHADVLRLLAEWESHWGKGATYAEALSWAARAYASKGHRDDAARCAGEAYALAADLVLTGEETPEVAALRHARDVALGASIEVQAQVAAGDGRGGEAASYLREMLALYPHEGFSTRIRKNLLQLTLAGEPALPLAGEALPEGSAITVPLGERPLVVFFWAHWCSDSRAQGRTLSRMFDGGAYPDVGLVAPTCLFGYITKGTPAAAEEEREQMATVLAAEYAWMARRPDTRVLLSAETVARYGASTFPTLVLIDGGGVVRRYHPGPVKFEDLRGWMDALLEGA